MKLKEALFVLNDMENVLGNKRIKVIAEYGQDCKEQFLFRSWNIASILPTTACSLGLGDLDISYFRYYKTTRTYSFTVKFK